MFGDLVERLVLRFGQLIVQVHQTYQADGAEQNESVVETRYRFEVQIEFGHQKTQDEVRGRTHAGPDVFAPGTRQRYI